MNKKLLFILLSCIVLSISIQAQDQKNMDASKKSDLPYYEIPSYPDSYTANNVAARMVDGLGFRYYWATEGLRKKDLKYKPSKKGRRAIETLEHLYGLSNVIYNAAAKKPNIRPAKDEELGYEELRRRTLENIKKTSDLLRAAKDNEMTEFKAVFQRGEKKSEYPFWNMINGPIADAIWHTGQVVLLRRASGNPFNSQVSVFNGKLRTR